ncbi:MAG: PAS domain-containing protein [Corynebacteriales bacterium]|nr:PAS domain-containing protein [Mycobacteriales bacterium]
MTRIELSLRPSEASDDSIIRPRVVGASSHLDLWLGAVTAAAEPCFLLDADGVIAGASTEFAELVGYKEATQLLGRGLLDDVVSFVDFTALAGPLPRRELLRIPALEALGNNGLARGRVRVRAGELVHALDMIASPVRLDGELAGVICFCQTI